LEYSAKQYGLVYNGLYGNGTICQRRNWYTLCAITDSINLHNALVPCHDFEHSKIQFSQSTMGVALSYNNTLSTAGERIYHAHGRDIQGRRLSSIVARIVAFLACIRKPWILAETSTILINVVQGFPQSSEINSENLPQILKLCHDHFFPCSF